MTSRSIRSTPNVAAPKTKGTPPPHESTTLLPLHPVSGHTTDLHTHLSIDSIRELHKLVIYLPHDALPRESRQTKYHRSRTAGFIHILPANDYLGIVKTLLTPAEVAEYLSFREELINRWEAEILAVPEPALVGQYLYGDVGVQPTVRFIEYLAQLDHRAEEWDMSGVISKFPDRITTDSQPTDYYLIVREMALLMRDELRDFKKRFQLSIEKARADEFVLPYRIAVPRTGCGFVFIPVTKEFLSQRETALKNFTLAHKYDLKLSKCIGVSIADDKDGWFTALWCYVEFPWEQNAETDELLKTSNPFRQTKTSEVSRYSYREPQQEK